MVGGEAGEGDVHVSALVAMAGVCCRWRMVVLGNPKCWEMGKGAVEEALNARRLCGLDDGFAEMHRLFRFSAKDDVVADAVVFAVGTDDAAMVRRARGLWPRMTAKEVFDNGPTLVKWIVQGAGRSVLAELCDWWGMAALREVISAQLTRREDNVQWVQARRLVVVLFFLHEIGVQFGLVRESNQDLVADVVGRGGGDVGVVAVLQMLRRWGMTLKDVQRCDAEILWRELRLSPDAAGELATWGLKLGVARDRVFSDRQESLFDTLQIGTVADLRRLREEWGMDRGDLVYNRRTRVTVVQLVALRLGRGLDVLEELVSGWGLKRFRDRGLLREIVSRVRGGRQAQVYASLGRLLGTG